MAEEKIKLGCVLTFDSEKDKDMIDLVNELKSRHKLGKYLNALIGLVQEREDLQEELRSQFEDEQTSRQKFFDGVREEVNQLVEDNKVIREELIELKAALKYGDSVGLLGKVENVELGNLNNLMHMREMSKKLNGNIQANIIEEEKELIDRTVDKVVDRVIEELRGIDVSKLASGMKTENKANNMLKENEDSQKISNGKINSRENSLEETKPEVRQSSQNEVVEKKEEKADEKQVAAGISFLSQLCNS